jgi:glutathione synthase/RimK-type ligase-like ATP-grasp enzyme
MGNKTLVYAKKVQDNLEESYKHLQRLDEAFKHLCKKYDFPISKKDYKTILNNANDVAFSDQIIYRFSKLQDCMGAKLFKSILLYQGENVDKPFLDILNQLEKMGIVAVDEWFELRDLRNEISHDYGEDEQNGLNMLNTIYSLKPQLENILQTIKNLV